MTCRLCLTHDPAKCKRFGARSCASMTGCGCRKLGRSALRPVAERLPTSSRPLSHDLGMNINSMHVDATATSDTSPILIIPYMWIGDFVRGHTVVRVLKERWPNRPVDLLTTSQCAPLVDYMPGIRSGIVWDLPRSRL